MDLSKENGLTPVKSEGAKPTEPKPTGPAFALVPLGDVAAADIAAGLSDFDVARWLSRAPFPYSVADARAYQAGCGDGVRAIVVGETFAGIIGIKPDLGYWLAKPFWGQGLATAASQNLLADHFFASDVPIVSGHFVGNTPSARVLARLGFRYTHVGTVTPLSTGVETVVERMALDRADWWAHQQGPGVAPQLRRRR